MNLKYLVLTGAMTAGCAFWPLSQPASAGMSAISAETVYAEYSADNVDDMLLHVSSNENQGFWKNLFNRSNRNTDAKPVFMQGDNKPGQAKPYDFGANDRRPDAAEYARRNLPPAADAIKEAGDVLERETRWAAAREREFIETIKKRAVERQAMLDGGSGGAAAGAGKKMIYDPARARDYDPNAEAKGESQQRSRIYNTR